MPRGRRKPGLSLLLLSLALLGGCVMFERPPAPLACNPQLGGNWIVPPGPTPAELPMHSGDRVVVDAACQVSLKRAAGQRGGFRALGFSLGEQHYLALSQHDLDSLFAVTAAPAARSGTPDAAVFLLQYRFQGDQLEIAMPDIAHTLHEIEQGRLRATRIDSSAYLLLGSENALQKLLAREPALFEAFGSGRPLNLRRAAPEQRA